MQTTTISTRFKWEGSKYASHAYIGAKELAKAIREDLKAQFPKYKFSVSKETYSGGRSIKVALMACPFKVFASPSVEPIADKFFRAFGRPPTQNDIQERLKYWEEEIASGHHTINEHYISQDEYLTQKAREVMQKVGGIIQAYNFDDSDLQTDYFHTNFYMHLSIGQYNKPVQIT